MRCLRRRMPLRRDFPVIFTENPQKPCHTAGFFHFKLKNQIFLVFKVVFYKKGIILISYLIMRRGSQTVRQRSAKSHKSVRLRSTPPFFCPDFYTAHTIAGQQQQARNYLTILLHFPHPSCDKISNNLYKNLVGIYFFCVAKK